MYPPSYSITMPRDISYRMMLDITPLLPSMDVPYSCVGETTSYSLKDIRRPIVVEKEEDTADVGNFPANILEHYWIRAGENDGDSWLACGGLDNGAYFFYSGSCDYTGFDCHGDMHLWVSNSWENIVEHAMSQREYELYIEQTIPPPEEDKDLCVCCEQDTATMPNDYGEQEGNVCADCFWGLREKARLSSPD